MMFVRTKTSLILYKRMQAIVHFYAEPVRNGPSRLSQSVALSAYFEQLNDPYLTKTAEQESCALADQ